MNGPSKAQLFADVLTAVVDYHVATKAFMDLPTAGLDPDTTAMVMDAVGRCKADVTNAIQAVFNVLGEP